MQVKEIKLLGDRLLIRPLKVFKTVETQYVPDTEKVKEMKDFSEEVPMFEKQVEIISDVQKAVILSVGNTNPFGFKSGDVILYNRKTVLPFAFLKNAYLLKVFDVIGVVEKMAIYEKESEEENQ